MEIKIETGDHATQIGKMLLWVVVGFIVISVVFTAVMLFYFMTTMPP